MDSKNTDFPQYRKLSNGKTFYKIIDDKNFEEIQIMGSKRMKYSTVANQYPEMLRIKDMLEFIDPYEESTENEFLNA
jgi:hypothetical protein